MKIAEDRAEKIRQAAENTEREFNHLVTCFGNKADNLLALQRNYIERVKSSSIETLSDMIGKEIRAVQLEEMIQDQIGIAVKHAVGEIVSQLNGKATCSPLPKTGEQDGKPHP